MSMCTHSPCSRSGIKHSLADINSSLVFQVCSCWYSNKNKDPPKRTREDAIMHRYPTLLIYPSTHCFGLGTIDSRDRMGRDSFISERSMFSSTTVYRYRKRTNSSEIWGAALEMDHSLFFRFPILFLKNLFWGREKLCIVMNDISRYTFPLLFFPCEKKPLSSFIRCERKKEK